MAACALDSVYLAAGFGVASGKKGTGMLHGKSCRWNALVPVRKKIGAMAHTALNCNASRPSREYGVHVRSCPYRIVTGCAGGPSRSGRQRGPLPVIDI